MTGRRTSCSEDQWAQRAGVEIVEKLSKNVKASLKQKDVKDLEYQKKPGNRG